MSPASDGAPDKRSWIELDLDPGTVVSEEAAVTNLSDQTVTFRIDAADGYFTDKGRFNMLPSDQESVDAGTWIQAPETVTVEPGAVGIVPFTVTVPDNAEPGDHAAGIAASLVSVGADAGGSSVGVESRIGFRVMTRVTGDVAPSVAVEDIATDYRLSWNPFAPGSLSVDAEIVNTGNVRLLLDGTVSAQGASAPLVAEDAAAQELLPGDRRTISVALDGVWPLFAIGADVTVAPTVVTPDGVDRAGHLLRHRARRAAAAAAGAARGRAHPGRTARRPLALAAPHRAARARGPRGGPARGRGRPLTHGDQLVARRYWYVIRSGSGATSAIVSAGVSIGRSSS
ncbi:DUF916 domain-containing protein [Rathayibacter oskolensis]|uniref:WxL protein peptidoglycan domain-containing protein n=1 Tax=Rathayibacter oskolensis TaxID=1891671 RepID=UPI00265FE1FE|nr:DUF916 domain-containing protein [Rathayibacter oskolensis]WKK72553.1 DUF916 domain-containing protein [Rathayibacter oskolensis]